MTGSPGASITRQRVNQRGAAASAVHFPPYASSRHANGRFAVYGPICNAVIPPVA